MRSIRSLRTIVVITIAAALLCLGPYLGVFSRTENEDFSDLPRGNGGETSGLSDIENMLHHNDHGSNQ